MAERIEVTATFHGPWATDVGARGHTIRIDEPESAGGEDTGLMPTEAFIASLAACFAMSVGWLARKRELEVRELSVTVTAHRAGKELRYERIEVETRAALDDETLARLVERAPRFCWVSNTLAAGVELEYRHTSLDARFRK